ncbi:dTDP-4-dehydrorhamnose reductase [Bacillus carboniphilus]|uniref:dTDP-4-dehydrorhamnose reductase n=1 Tax=Bacillus carboniphilus TaxID=86663 RepID=A0ABY9JRI5_9BACI|nr:dTDP-4-dehydrorhamnose reductase [Bacillus carboniphilus]WLR42021.1 dTDP-4-dehydrorhamnose reductase [Bacillus carboniphilus]
MKVIITGGLGQLGTAVHKVFSERAMICHPLGKKELNITSMDQIIYYFNHYEPNMVVHCGAFTNVDGAESKKDQAYLINAIGTKNLAICCENYRIPLVYISTDYVFDGTSSTPYHEFDQPNPINEYGKSKLAGEEMVKQYCSSFYIIRTSWLYSYSHHNFLQTMLRLGKQREPINVVNDQIGSPTYTYDLAEKMVDIFNKEHYGTYHVANSGYCSWYEFAEEIFRIKGMDIRLNAVPTEDFPRDAKRPSFSKLDQMSLRLYKIPPSRHWKSALKSCLNH